MLIRPLERDEVPETGKADLPAAALVGVGPGPFQGTEDLAGCTLTVGERVITHGLLLNVGLIGGSLVAALLPWSVGHHRDTGVNL